jgi:hypothetical protein
LVYVAALGSKNLTLIYGPAFQFPYVVSTCISAVPYGVSLGTFLAIKIIPLTTKR